MTADSSGLASEERITIVCLDDERDTFPAWITSLDGGGIVRVRVPRELPEGMRIEVRASPEYSGVSSLSGPIKRAPLRQQRERGMLDETEQCATSGCIQWVKR